MFSFLHALGLGKAYMLCLPAVIVGLPEFLFLFVVANTPNLRSIVPIVSACVSRTLVM